MSFCRKLLVSKLRMYRTSLPLPTIVVGFTLLTYCKTITSLLYVRVVVHKGNWHERMPQFNSSKLILTRCSTWCLSTIWRLEWLHVYGQHFYLSWLVNPPVEEATIANQKCGVFYWDNSARTSVCTTAHMLQFKCIRQLLTFIWQLHCDEILRIKTVTQNSMRTGSQHKMTSFTSNCWFYFTKRSQTWPNPNIANCFLMIIIFIGAQLEKCRNLGTVPNFLGTTQRNFPDFGIHQAAHLKRYHSTERKYYCSSSCFSELGRAKDTVTWSEGSRHTASKARCSKL